MASRPEPNRIPSEPFVAVVREYLSRQVDGHRTEAPDDPGLAPISLLALRCDIKEDTLRSFLQGRNKTIDFDLADWILTKMNRVDAWRHELAEWYSVPLPEGGRRRAERLNVRVCAADNCATEFEIVNRGAGSTKIYCSHRCNQRMVYRRRKGLSERYGTADKCPGGHEWTPESTRVDQRTNKRYCRRCQADYQQRRRARGTEESKAA